MRVYVQYPFTQITLSWKQRLLSWPWRPFQKKKWVQNVSCPPEGTVWTFGDRIYCRQEDYYKLKREIPEITKPNQIIGKNPYDFC